MIFRHKYPIIDIMSSEIVLPEQFPGVNWSTSYIHEDGEPADTYGVIGALIGSSDYRMDSQHRLVVTQKDHNFRYARIRFGTPGNTTFTVFAEEDLPFNLTYPDRINDATKLVGGILTTLHQEETADRIVISGEELVRTLKSVVGFGSSEVLNDIGLIEEVTRRYTQGFAKAKVLEDARMLKQLQVPLFYEGNGLHDRDICWTTSHLIMFLETGHCPPLPVDQYKS